MKIPIFVAKEIPQIEYAEAYWISPSGKIKAVPTSHIEVVIGEPVAFGMSTDSVQQVYDKYNEPLGYEGMARDEIMEELFKKGWVRIRYNPMEDIYDVELSKLTTDEKDCLYTWACALVRVSSERKSSPVHIFYTEGGLDLPVYSVGDLTLEVLYDSEELKRNFRKTIIPISSEYRFLDTAPVIRFKELVNAAVNEIGKSITDIVSAIGETEAHWISPNGELLPVSENHIDKIKSNPKAFGLTDNFIALTVSEALNRGDSGDDMILDVAIKNGWIRIRYYQNLGNMYLIDLWELADKIKEYLWSWALGAVNLSDKRSGALVRIEEKGTGVSLELTVEELAGQVLFSKYDPDIT